MTFLTHIVSAFRGIGVSVLRQTPSLPSHRYTDTPALKMIVSVCRRIGASENGLPFSLLSHRNSDTPKPRYLPLFVALLLLNSLAFASGPGTTTGELLKIPVGTRAIGMGEAYTALADDSSALQWNPAGLSFANQKEASFMHSSLIENVHYEHLSYIAPGDSYSAGASMSYLGYGDIAGYDNTGAAIGNQSANAYIFSGGIASLIKEALSLGITGSFLHEKLADTSAGSFAVNAGSLLALPWHPLQANYRLGASILNVGPGLKFVSDRDPLPRKIKFGFAALHVEDWPINLTADVTIPNDNSTFVSLGSEYWFRDLIALRLGYAGSNDEGKGLRLGVGLKLRGVLFDYAYGSFGDFGATHRVSLALRFGDKIKQLNREERAILKEAKASQTNGDYVQSILDMNEILEKNPNDDHILKQMIATHEAMLKKELHEAVAQSKEDIPSPEEFALQDLVPGQQSMARAQNAADDPLGLRNLPDVNNLDVPSTADLLSKPIPSTSPQPKAVPTVSQPSPNETKADSPLINPGDIK